MFGGVVVELRPAFNANDVAFLMKQFRIPSGSHADRLRETRWRCRCSRRRATLRSSNHRPAGRAAEFPAPLILAIAPTFSASDMRRIKSSARAFKGCEGSRQIGGFVDLRHANRGGRKCVRQFRSAERDDRRARGILYLEGVEFRGALVRRK